MIGAFLGLNCCSVSSFSADAIFWDYNAQEALLLPASTRAASRIYFTFQQAIKTITLVDITPIISSKKCSSLRHFSFSGTFAGLPCRPCLPNPSETCQAVFDYISRLGGADSFYLPMKLLSAPLPFNVGPLQEIPMSQRHQVWQRTVTRRYKQKARDRRQQSCHVICACSCTASWFTLSFLTPCTPRTQQGALVLRLRSSRIPSKQG